MELSFRSAVLAAGLVVTAASSASAAVLDFTDKSVVAGISGNTLVGSGWVATGSPISTPLFSAEPGPGPLGPLKGQTDGLGLLDGEITYPSESLTISFKKSVTLSAVYFLNLFFGEAGTEFALLAVDGVPNASFGAMQFNPGAGNTNPGYAAFTGLNFKGKQFTFSVALINDIEGTYPDYSLAGMDVTPLAPVPLPAGALLLGTALTGFGIVRRMKRSG